MSPRSLVIMLFLLAASATAQTHRFIAVGDSRGSDNGVNSSILTEIAQAIIDENAEFVVFPGDLVTGSTDQATLTAQLTTWRDHLQPVYDAGIGVYPCRGNHDDDYKASWDAVFSGPHALPTNGPAGEGNITYSFTHGTIFVAAMDLYVSGHRVNQAWLDQQFAANTRPHVFVFTHEPAFKVLHPDTLDDYPVKRNTFWDSLKAAGGRTYFCGHDHFYDHLRADDGNGDPDDDLHQYLVGTAGAPLYDDGAYDGNNGTWSPVRVHHEKRYGYVLVEIDGLGVTLTWKRRLAPGIFQAGVDIFTYSVPAAACSWYCGTGINMDTYTVAAPYMIGGTFQGTVGFTAPNIGAVIAGYLGRLTFPIWGQEGLVDVGGREVLGVPMGIGASPVTITWPVPDEPAYAGMHVSTQAAGFGGGVIHLTCAYDCTIGF
jgi:hypothetical protein